MVSVWFLLYICLKYVDDINKVYSNNCLYFVRHKYTKKIILTYIYIFMMRNILLHMLC